MRALVLIVVFFLSIGISIGQVALDPISSGDTKFDKADYLGAIADYALVIDADFKNEPIARKALASLKRGHANYKLKDYQQAWLDFRNANFYGEDDAETEHWAGCCSYQLGENARAIREFTNALLENPKSGDSFYMRATVKMTLKDFRGAIADYSEVINLFPTNATGWYERGLARFMLDDFQGSIEDLSKSIDIVGTVYWDRKGFAFYIRGCAKGEMGFTDEACLDLSKAGELGYIEAYDQIQKNCQ